MVLLAVSILALAIGPLLLHASGPRAAVLALLDGYVLVALLGIVVFYILPTSIALGGGAGAAAAGPLPASGPRSPAKHIRVTPPISSAVTDSPSTRPESFQPLPIERLLPATTPGSLERPVATKNFVAAGARPPPCPA